MTPGNNTIWTVSPHVRSTYTDDGAVLLDIKKGVCYGLNPTAARVWGTLEGCNGGLALESIVNDMERHFPVPRQQLAGDTAECLRKLLQMGLIQLHGDMESPQIAPRGS
jgi:Coenzyme PQQ synthesis protein D (PqqD)